jgi:sialate O-acetylesterase
MHAALRSVFLILSMSLATLVSRAAEPRPFLSPIFGDHMVLQRGKPNTFWGWTQPGEGVRVEIAGRVGEGTAGGDGRWQVQVDPPGVGETCEVVVTGSQRVVLRNVIVGDVWLCGGQSNMRWGLPATDGAEEAIAAADLPGIRLFAVTPKSAYAPANTVEGAWQVCTPKSVSDDGGFSAVAFYFARKVHAETGVPIGLIEDCLGGTPAESWMSPETLTARGDFERPMAEIARLRAAGVEPYGNYIMHWYDEHDAGIRGTPWSTPELDDSDWRRVPLMNAFVELGLAKVPAVVWFRREVVLPDPLPAGDATLSLGVVEKMDTAHLNGRWIGASSWVENPRRYRVPADALKSGVNQLALRVFKLKSRSAFESPPEQINLTLGDGTVIPLAGEWKARVSVNAAPPFPLPLGFENYPTMPAVLYNGMIAPVAPLALAGALWYQGEANASRAHQYRTLMPALIADWRRVFGQGDFPFYLVSLPAFQQRKTSPGSDDWAELREAQALTAKTVPNTGLAITIDTGDANDIHPRDKRPVGERLALLALAGHYGKEVVAQGPSYRSMRREGGAIRIRFDRTHGGLVAHGDGPAEFAVAGADRRWVWARARIEGDTVVVSSPEVPEPMAVRYAWQANPQATLFNGAGLPAAPFRTDDWPGVTEGRPPW